MTDTSAKHPVQCFALAQRAFCAKKTSEGSLTVKVQQVCTALALHYMDLRREVVAGRQELFGMLERVQRLCTAHNIISPSAVMLQPAQTAIRIKQRDFEQVTEGATCVARHGVADWSVQTRRCSSSSRMDQDGCFLASLQHTGLWGSIAEECCRELSLQIPCTEDARVSEAATHVGKQ